MEATSAERLLFGVTFSMKSNVSQLLQ